MPYSVLKVQPISGLSCCVQFIHWMHISSLYSTIFLDFLKKLTCIGISIHILSNFVSQFV
jgi:hypothetical protein